MGADFCLTIFERREETRKKMKRKMMNEIALFIHPLNTRCSSVP